MKKIGVLLAILLIAGCSSSNTLSRGKAKDILNASYKSNAAPAALKPTPDEVKALVSQGMISVTNNVFCRCQIPAVLQHGKSFLSGWQGAPATGGFYLITAQPLKTHVVEVTGITDAPGDSSGHEKVVEYTAAYDFDNAPSEFKTIFKDYPAVALSQKIKLYDDGWRMVN